MRAGIYREKASRAPTGRTVAHTEKDMIVPNRHYRIEPRPPALGGGWRLALVEDGEEVGGGVFPLAEYVGEPSPERAAHDDAQAEGEAWVAGR